MSKPTWTISNNEVNHRCCNWPEEAGTDWLGPGEGRTRATSQLTDWPGCPEPKGTGASCPTCLSPAVLFVDDLRTVFSSCQKDHCVLRSRICLAGTSINWLHYNKQWVSAFILGFGRRTNRCRQADRHSYNNVKTKLLLAGISNMKYDENYTPVTSVELHMLPTRFSCIRIPTIAGILSFNWDGSHDQLA